MSHINIGSLPASQPRVQWCRLSKYLEKGKGRESESERQEGEGEVKAVVKFSELHSRSCLIPGRQGAASGQRAAGGRRHN